MKQVLVFLTCALLFELSNQIEIMPEFRHKNPITFERGCRIENGTLVCAKPKTFNSTKTLIPLIRNQTKCSAGYRLNCHKVNSGQTYCNCSPLSIFKPTNKTANCPNGTVYKCSHVRRGCVVLHDCSCKKVQLSDLIYKITNISKLIVEEFKNSSKIKH